MQTAATVVRSAQPEDAQAVIAMFVLAYAADPVMRFILRAPERYRDGAVEMFRQGVALGLEHGTLDFAEDGSAAALWTPPGGGLGQARVAELMQRIVEPARRSEVFAGMAGAHHDDGRGPGWYLQSLGVDPLRQGRGRGSALLRHGLARIDARGEPVRLLCSNPRNVVLYARHGFEVAAQTAIAPDVPVTHMWRPAAGA